MDNYHPVKLIEYLRDGLVEQEHSGFFVKVSATDVFKLGNDKNYPYFLRSCAKPLQASLLIDYGLDEFYDMTSEEIALCCASHAGEPCHVSVGQRLLEKMGINKSYLKCGLHKPISKTEQNKLLISGENENVFQNNCSGKHIMMLGICKKMGWKMETYDEINHPLQIAIKNKIYELCEIHVVGQVCPTTLEKPESRVQFTASIIETQDYPVTKDGCGVPIHAMPLENMARGFLNLFTDDKYSKICNAFLENPYLIGGEDRLDAAIMSASKNLIAKVGAGGLCIVVNLETKEALIIKVMDCDMKARAIALIEALSQLNWLDEIAMEHPLVKSQNKTDILTLHGEKIGFVTVLFNFQ